MPCPASKAAEPLSEDLVLSFLHECIKVLLAALVTEAGVILLTIAFSRQCSCAVSFSPPTKPSRAARSSRHRILIALVLGPLILADLSRALELVGQLGLSGLHAVFGEQFHLRFAQAIQLCDQRLVPLNSFTIDRWRLGGQRILLFCVEATFAISSTRAFCSAVFRFCGLKRILSCSPVPH